jgi:hypothetical protein
MGFQQEGELGKCRTCCLGVRVSLSALMNGEEACDSATLATSR